MGENKTSITNAGIMSRLTMAVLLAMVSATLLCFRVCGAQGRQGSLQQEIAQVEQEVDRIEADALAAIPPLLPGSPARVAGLGKTLFYDKALSVNRNEACAFCHMPQAGFQGAIESLNKAEVAQPGSVRTRCQYRPRRQHQAVARAARPGASPCSRSHRTSGRSAGPATLPVLRQPDDRHRGH